MISLEKINRRFRQLGEMCLRWRYVFIVILVVLDLVAMVGISRVKMQSSWDSWFFEDDPIVQATNKFENIFGNSDGGAIHVTAADVFSHDTLAMIRELGQEIEEKVEYVDKVVSLADFEFARGVTGGMKVGNLVPDEIPESKSELEKIRVLAFGKKNLVNKLFSDDSKETWITVRLKNFSKDAFKGGAEPLYVIGDQINNIVSQDKYKKFDLKTMGMTAVAYDKMNFFKKEAGKIIMLSLAAAVFVLLIFLRSLRGLVVPLVITLSGILVSYGAMGFLGIKIDSMTMTVPIYLALAVSIGYSIHIFNFFKRGMSINGVRRDAVLHAYEHTGWPLLFTAFTTIGCMLSFNFIDITSIRWIGNASAAMLVVIYLYVMILTPVLLSFGKNKKISGDEKLGSDRIMIPLSAFVLKRKLPILVVSTILIAVFAMGLFKIRVDFEPFSSFGLKVPYVKKIYDVVNTKTGSMYSYNLFVELPENGMAKDPEQLRKFEQLETEVKSLSLTKSTMSILEILKDQNKTLHGGDDSFYVLPKTRELVSQYLLLYESSGGKEAEYWMDYDYKFLRLSVSQKEFSADEVQRELEFLEKRVSELFPGSKFGMVGSSIEGAVVQNYIAQGQIKSFIIALLVIGILMIVVFRSFRAGLIGLIPNLAPVAVVGGAMGYMDIPLDMMTMTLLPMLMGIAVDDSIHFVNHMKYEIESGCSYEEAVKNTFKTVGRALMLTSLILIITFSMYMSSDVNIYYRLGALVSLGIFTALVADYFLTPVLVVLTRPFKSQTYKSDDKRNISGSQEVEFESAG